MRSGAWRALPWVTGGNALGFMTHHLVSAWRAVRRRMGSHQCTSVVVIRQKPEKPLGEDGGRCPAVMLTL